MAGQHHNRQGRAGLAVAKFAGHAFALIVFDEATAAQVPPGCSVRADWSQRHGAAPSRTFGFTHVEANDRLVLVRGTSANRWSAS
jgi:hypothetical protein